MENSAIAEIVSVGLFLSDETYAAQTDSTTSAVMQDIVAHPIRPWVYGVDGDSSIYIYDLYSAQELGSYSIGGNLNSIAISNDGQSIFVFDSLGKRVFVVDTYSLTINNELSLASVPGNSGQGLAFLRPRGLDLILVGGSTFDTALDIEQNCINPPSRDVAIRILRLSSDGFRGVVFSDPDYYNEDVQPVTFFNALH